jgi:tetratricopeptide (TPR) repeat protein
MTTLKNIIQKEKTHSKKCQNPNYYHSDKAKTEGKELSALQKEYIKNNPQDYKIQGAQIHKTYWHAIPDYPPAEQKIFELTGKGKCYEVHKEYEKAITYYQKAEKQTEIACRNDLKQLIADYGPGDYLYLKAIRQRIRVCEKNIQKMEAKKLETEAKELEKTNPEKAIEIYEKLNVMKPGLKKYNKRIEICKKKL